MFLFKYIDNNGVFVTANDKLSKLAQSKGRLVLSQKLGKIEAVNLDAAKRGMCDIRKQCLRSVDALALGEDHRLYFIEFKDRNLSALCSQGKNPQKEALQIEREMKCAKRKQQYMANSRNAKQESTIEVELQAKIFDSVLLAGLGDEQWREVDFTTSFGVIGSSDILNIRNRSVFVVVYNDTSYDADATDGERKILSALKTHAEIKSCQDPQIPTAKIYWGLEELVSRKYCKEVHTLSVPEFESYAKNRFKSVS